MSAFTETLKAAIVKGGPYIGPRGGKWADPQHKIAWREDVPRHARHEHSIAAHHGLRSHVDTDMAEMAEGFAKEDGVPFTEKDAESYHVHHITAPNESKIAGIRLTMGGGKYAVIHRSSKPGVQWQASYFDDDGPSGDSPRKSLNDALKAARDRGYKVSEIVKKGGAIELPEPVGLEMWNRQERMFLFGVIAKAGVKYVRRVPTGNPKRPWKYYYSDSSTAHAAKEGERINMREAGQHDVVHVRDGVVKLRHAKTGHERDVHVSDLHSEMHGAYRERMRKGAERVAARLIGRAGAVRGKAGPKDLWDVYKRRFAAAGVDMDHAKALIGFIGTRNGWTSDARTVLAEMATDPKWSKRIGGRERIVAAGAEGLRVADKAKAVDGHHVVRAALLPSGVELDKIRSGVAELTGKLEGLMSAADATGNKALHSYAVEVANNQDAALLAESVAAWPALADAPEVARLNAIKARVAALSGRRKDDGGKGLRGADTTVFVADASGNPDPQTARFRLVESGDVAASHDPTRGFAQNPKYPEGVQERAYHRDKEHQGVVRENARKLRPELVINTNPDATNGPPIITRDGVVLGGNSRSMSIAMAHAEGGESSARYIQHLKDNAASFGFAPGDVDKMKSPILVREVDTGPADKKQLGVLVRRYNEVFTQGMDPRVDQVARGRLVTPSMMDTLAAAMGEKKRDGTLAHPTLGAYLGSRSSVGMVRSMESAGIIDRRNRAVYLRKDGTLNEDGKTFAERLLVGRVVPEPDMLSEMKQSQVAAVARSVPHIVRAASHGHDLAPALKEAITADVYMNRHGISSVDELHRSQSLADFAGEAAGFEGKPKLSPEGLAVLGILRDKPGPVQMSSAFRDFAEHAARNPAGQADLLGMSRSTADLVRMVKGVVPMWIDIPDDVGAALWRRQQFSIAKGANHKYVKRIPTGNPKRPFRYVYSAEGSRGVAHQFHMKVGAAFRVGEGHYHVTAVDGDSVSIVHDETGDKKTLTKDQLSQLLSKEHKSALDAHVGKLRAKLTRATGVHAHNLRSRIKGLGGGDGAVKLTDEQRANLKARLAKLNRAIGVRKKFGDADMVSKYEAEKARVEALLNGPPAKAPAPPKKKEKAPAEGKSPLGLTVPKKPESVDVKSSNVAGFDWAPGDGHDGTMTVRFRNGTSYEYPGTSYDDFRALGNANSQGISAGKALNQWKAARKADGLPGGKKVETDAPAVAPENPPAKPAHPPAVQALLDAAAKRRAAPAEAAERRKKVFADAARKTKEVMAADAKPSKPPPSRKADKALADKMHALAERLNRDHAASEPQAHAFKPAGKEARELAVALQGRNAGGAERKRAEELLAQDSAARAKEIADLETSKNPNLWAPKPVREKPMSVADPEGFNKITERQKQLREDTGREPWQRTSGEVKRVLSMPVERHRKAVADAIRQGKDVPQRVMDEYKAGTTVPHADDVRAAMRSTGATSGVYAGFSEAGKRAMVDFRMANNAHYAINQPKKGDRARSIFGLVGTVDRVFKRSVRLKKDDGTTRTVEIGALGLPDDDAMSLAVSKLTDAQVMAASHSGTGQPSSRRSPNSDALQAAAETERKARGLPTASETLKASPPKAENRAAAPADVPGSQRKSEAMAALGVSVHGTDVPRALAVSAHSGTSHVPDRRADGIAAEYVAHMDDVAGRLGKLAKTPEDKAKLVDALKSYKYGYLSKLKAHLDAKSRVMSSMVTGPARFPVERNRKRGDTADRRGQELVDWSDKETKRIERSFKAPATAETDGDKHERLIAEHKALKDHRASSPSEIRNALARLRSHEAKMSATPKESSKTPFDGGHIHDDEDTDRVRIVFDEKPDASVRARAKAAGFRWSNRYGGWQRKRTDNGRRAAADLVASLTTEKGNRSTFRALFKSAVTA